MQKCYKYIYDTITKFAEENDYDGVVIPSKGASIVGECTNRGGDFSSLIKDSRLRDKKDRLRIVEFGDEHELGKHKEKPYTYSDGALIWEKAG